MMPIVSTLERGQFTVKLRAFSSQREDYEEFPITVDVRVSEWWNYNVCCVIKCSWLQKTADI